MRTAAEAFFGSREFQIFKGVRILMREEPFIVLDDVRARVTQADESLVTMLRTDC